MAKTVEMQTAASPLVMDREKLFMVSIAEMQAEMQKDLAAWDAEMQTKSEEELRDIESQLMEEFKKNDEYIKSVKYNLPDDVEFNGQKVSSKDICVSICGFLNKLEVEWKATLGIYQAIKFWETFDGTEVPYAVFDSTLRLLGTLKFCGEKQCFDILVINNYMAQAHDAYIKDTTWLQYLSAKHNSILQAMQKLGTADNAEK